MGVFALLLHFIHFNIHFILLSGLPGTRLTSIGKTSNQTSLNTVNKPLINSTITAFVWLYYIALNLLSTRLYVLVLAAHQPWHRGTAVYFAVLRHHNVLIRSLWAALSYHSILPAATRPKIYPKNTRVSRRKTSHSPNKQRTLLHFQLFLLIAAFSMFWQHRNSWLSGDAKFRLANISRFSRWCTTTSFHCPTLPWQHCNLGGADLVQCMGMHRKMHPQAFPLFLSIPWHEQPH